MTYPPNENAVAWFARHVFPRVRSAAPEARFFVVGSDPSPQVRALEDMARVHVTGWVPDVRVRLRAATVVVNAVRFGSGTRVKLLEAMAVGAAVVSTTLGAEGLDLRPGVHLEVGDTPEEFARLVRELIADSDRRETLGRQAKELIQGRYSWEIIGAELVANLRRAVARDPNGTLRVEGLRPGQG